MQDFFITDANYMCIKRRANSVPKVILMLVYRLKKVNIFIAKDVEQSQQ